MGGDGMRDDCDRARRDARVRDGAKHGRTLCRLYRGYGRAAAADDRGRDPSCGRTDRDRALRFAMGDWARAGSCGAGAADRGADGVRGVPRNSARNRGSGMARWRFADADFSRDRCSAGARRARRRVYPELYPELGRVRFRAAAAGDESHSAAATLLLYGLRRRRPRERARAADDASRDWRRGRVAPNAARRADDRRPTLEMDIKEKARETFERSVQSLDYAHVADSLARLHWRSA